MHPSLPPSFRIHRIVALSSLMIALLSSSVYALTYPGSTPPGEVTGGTYRTYFDNMFFAPCPTGQTIRGFSSSGVPNCIAGAAALSISWALGYTLYHDGTDWVSSPNIYNANGNVGIGTSTGTAKLTVSDDILVRGVNIGRWPGNPFMWPNLRFGTNALRVNTTGGMNTAIGNNALYSNLTGEWNVALGTSALAYNTAGSYNTAVGVSALTWNNGNSNTAFGMTALTNNTTWGFNTAIWQGALWWNTTGDSNVALWSNAGFNLQSGVGNIFLGESTAINTINGSRNIVIGYNLSTPQTTISDYLSIWDWIYGNAGNIGIGTNSSLTAKLTVAGQVKITGGSPGVGKVLTSDATGLATWVIPTASVVTATGVIGGTGTENYIPKFGIGGNGLYPSSIFESGGLVGIGTSTGIAKLTVAGQIKITGGSPAANKVLVSDATGLASWQNAPTPCVPAGSGIENECYGSGALQANLTGPFNVAFWFWALTMNSNGGVNTAIGNKALRDNTTGWYNSVVGWWAMKLNQTGYFNSVLGANALWDNVTGNSNVAIGSAALRNSTNSSYNIAIGEQALWGLEYGDGNIGIGLNVSIWSGSNNIIIWNNLALASWSINQLNIGNWIYGSGGNIGIGTSLPRAKLEVSDDIIVHGFTIGLGAWSSDLNLAIGSWVLSKNSIWDWNMGIWFNSLFNNVDGFENMALWGNALFSNTSGSDNTAIGVATLQMNLTGNNNTAIGYFAGRNILSSNNTAIGYYSMIRNTTGTDNVAIGSQTLGGSLGGTGVIYRNVAIGASAGYFITSSATDNVFLWYRAWYASSFLSWANNVVIGSNAGVPSGFSNNIAIGSSVSTAIGFSNQLNIGNWIYGSGGNIGIGTSAWLTKKLTVNGDALINSVTVGKWPGTASNNTVVWSLALNSATIGGYNTAIGASALFSNVDGTDNMALGYGALRSNVSGYQNVAIGSRTLENNQGDSNVSIWYLALQANLNGSYNTAIGERALYPNTNGNNNIGIGYNAWVFASGSGTSTWSNNIFIGNNIYLSSSSDSNRLNIGNWIYGSGGNIGIGTSTGTAKLTVAGDAVINSVTVWRGGGASITNTIVGSTALPINTTGIRNTVMGLGSAASNTTGSENTLIGYLAQMWNSTGSYNAAFGEESLYQNMSNYNTAIGWRSWYPTGTPNFLYGNNNTFLGANTQYGPQVSNATAVGASVFLSQSNTVILGSGADVGIGTSNPGAKLEVAGQIKITGGSPGVGKVLVSDASGVASWQSYASGSTATGIVGGVQNYVSKFGTGGNGLYASQIFDNGTNVAIGTGTATKKLTIDSNLVNDSGLRLSRISSTSTAYTGAAMGLGVDANGNVIPISNGDVVVYDGIDRASPPTPDPNIAGRQISYDFNNFFDIPTKQSFVVSDGSSASNNGPYFKENGSSAVCSWNGTYGSSAYNCATADPVTGLSASPHNSFTMTAKGTTFGYQIALGARGDAPLFARSGRFNGAQGGGLYTNDSPYQTPAPWQKVLTVPANHPEYLYVNTGLNSQLQTQTGGGNVGIGTTFPNSRFEVWTGATTSPLLHFRGTNNVAMGLGAMNVAVSGNANSAYGAESLFSITTGYSNAAFGYRALRTNAGGYNNVSIGQESLFSNNGGSWNSAVGYQALYSNSSGTGNIAFGPQALYNLTTGNSNIAIGYQAARVIAGSSVSRNIAIGYQSLYSSTASDLIAIGHQALYANSSGVRNTAIGYQSLDSVTSGSGNTAVGYDTLSQTTGSNNTAYGNGAGNGITSGSNNIAIGSNAQVPTATASNQLSIGNWIYGNGGNIGIGTSSSLTAKLTVAGTVKLGTNGSTLNNIIKVANALDVPSVAAGACTAQTTTVTNAAVGWVASVSPASALTDRMIIAYARVSAANTVEIKFCNESSAPIDLASMSYYISVIQ